MTNRSKPIARFSGIDVSIHWTFYLLLGWIVLNGLFTGGLGTAVVDVVFLAAAFSCVVLHEFGHAFAARMFGIPTHGITLYPIGGVAMLDNIPRSPAKELVIAIAGPAVNVVLAVILFPIVAAVSAEVVTPQGLLLSALLERLLLINIGLVVFNLIPAFPMDGGRVLRAICASLTDYVSATRIAVRCGQIVAGILAIVGVIYNPMLLLIAAFVAFAAQSELYGVIASEREFKPYGSVIDAVRVAPGKYAAAFHARRELSAQEKATQNQTQSNRAGPAVVTIVWSDSRR
jgi:stage IV sporulation protein FB